MANKTLHTAKKHNDVTITIHPIRPEDLRFIAFLDASFAPKSKPESHAGMIILATHKDISQNKSCLISPISWGTKKIQRVVTSTLSAETSALSTALDQLTWVRLYQAWMITQRLSGNNLSPSNSSWRDLHWAHSGAQLADAHTKVMEGNFLRETLRQGRFCLHDENEVLKNRASARIRLKWLRSAADQIQTYKIFKFANVNRAQLHILLTWRHHGNNQVFQNTPLSFPKACMRYARESPGDVVGGSLP